MKNLICLLGSAESLRTVDIFVFLGIILLLFFSAFFSASEIAFSSSNTIRLKSLAEENKSGARKALYIKEHFDKALSTILVGNNFVNILSTTLCAYLFVKIIVDPVLYNIINTIVMTTIILIFGEILPKAWAKSNAEKTALKLASVLFVVMKISYFFCIPFNFLQKKITKKQKKVKSPTITENEFESIVETMEDEGVLDEQNADMIFGTLKFKDKSVKDIMTPRVDLVCISINSNVEEIKNTFLTSQYSRIPIYKKSKDNIVGILNQKDFFSALIENKEIDIEKMLTPALFVSENTKINNAMKFMQKEKKHIAVVSDEYGGTSGIVTLEDCVEEVFGEVYDEYDENLPKDIEEIGDNRYKLDANVNMDELFEFLKIEKKIKNRFSTLATFLCEIGKKVPQQNDVINYKVTDEILNEDSQFIKKEILLSFTLSKVERRRIKEVELSIKR